MKAEHITAIFIVPTVEFRDRRGGTGTWSAQYYANDTAQAFEMKHGKSPDYLMRARHTVFVEHSLPNMEGAHSKLVFGRCATRREAEYLAHSLRGLQHGRTIASEPVEPFTNFTPIDMGAAA